MTTDTPKSVVQYSTNENRLILLALGARHRYFTFMRTRGPYVSKPFGLP